MNPVEVEKGVAGYIRALAGLPAGVQVHEGVSAEDVDFERQAVVVEMSDAEHRGINLFLANVSVSLRSPAMVATQGEHAALFATLGTALQAQSPFGSAFNAAATGVQFGGSYVTNIPGAEFQDRAWVNSLQLALGVRAV